MASVGELGRVGVDGLSLVLVCPAGHVANVVCDSDHVDRLGDGEGFSVVERLDGCQLILVGVDEISELHEKLTTLGTGDIFTPDGVERVTSCLDGSVNVLCICLRDLSNLFASGRVDDWERLAGCSGDKLVVNEETSGDCMRGGGVESAK